MHATVIGVGQSVEISAPADFEEFYLQERRRVLALAAVLTGRWDVAEELS